MNSIVSWQLNFISANICVYAIMFNFCRIKLKQKEMECVKVNSVNPHYCKTDVWGEGVCIRINDEVFKFKSSNFLLMEEKQLEQETSNIEDQQ